MSTDTAQLIERAFWWIVGIFSTLFISGVSAVISVLWAMNSSVVTLNTRVGTVIERLDRTEQQGKLTDAELRSHTGLLTVFGERLRTLEARLQEKSRR